MSISREDLERAYYTLQNDFEQLSVITDWEGVRILQSLDVKILRITKNSNIQSNYQNSLDEPEKELVEVDDAAVSCLVEDLGDALIVYDIIYSPSYQVPALYVTFKSTGLSTSQPPMEELYQLLSPASLQDQLRNVGVVGALSMTDHPVAGTPAHFVHPCRTAEAMEAIIGSEKATPERYLMVWIGLIGQSVGLDIPIQLAEAMSNAI